MPSTVTSAFSDPDDFDTALRKEGVLSLLVTARGQFRARLTQISLDEICISAVEKQSPRQPRRLCTEHRHSRGHIEALGSTLWSFGGGAVLNPARKSNDLNQRRIALTVLPCFGAVHFGAWCCALWCCALWCCALWCCALWCCALGAVQGIAG